MPLHDFAELRDHRLEMIRTAVFDFELAVCDRSDDESSVSIRSGMIVCSATQIVHAFDVDRVSAGAVHSRAHLVE